MTEINAFHIAFYSSALLISLTSLVYTFIQGRIDKLQNKLYIIMLVILVLNSASGIAGAIVDDRIASYNSMRMVAVVSQFFYFLLHTALAPVFCYYVMSVTGTITKYKRSRLLLYAVPLIATEFFVISNPVVGWVYYYDDGGDFHRNWAESLIYLAAVLYFVFAIGNLMTSWRSLTNKRRLALLYFIILVIVGTLIQALFIEIKSELFSQALALLGVMLTVESEDERLDSDTGVYNRKALQMDLNNYIVSKQVFYVVCLKIANSDTVQRITGSSDSDILSKLIADYLKSITTWYSIYHTAPETFVVTLLNYDSTAASELVKIIDERFEKSWIIKETEAVLTPVIILAQIPIDLYSTDDVFYMADTPIPPSNTKRILNGNDLDYLIRRMAVENAIHRGLEQKNFEVYYQPTYYLEGLRLHGAEALVRLHDPELGNIFPDEFIPSAEQMGIIDAIDDFVLTEVCDFLKSGIPVQMGMDVINVNLSVIQCMRPGFVEHILSIVEKSGIDKSLINFEITESVAASDYKVLSHVVKELKDNGFMFSMDDYGTGYSNMQSIFSLDFDIVKIDKSILWGAEKSEMGKIILENSVRMIKQMHRKILVEGVETKEQIELLSKQSVDYLQGYYFSRPVPKKEFLEIISKPVK